MVSELDLSLFRLKGAQETYDVRGTVAAHEWHTQRERHTHTYTYIHTHLGATRQLDDA
jgi:hypothetical protein